MPKTSPLVKINAVKGYGGIVTLCEPNVESRENKCLRIMKETGATLIHLLITMMSLVDKALSP